MPFQSQAPSAFQSLKTRVQTALVGAGSVGDRLSQRDCPVQKPRPGSLMDVYSLPHIPGNLKRSGCWAVYDDRQRVAGMDQDDNGTPTPVADGGRDTMTALLAYNADYAVYVALGTTRMAANPFFTNAVTAMQDRFAAEVRG